VKQNYQNVDLDVNPIENLPLNSIYQEAYPFWFGTQIARMDVSDFKVGNRVMNINSTRRLYIPFGARGTVVGNTEETLIVLFDDQFLQGTNIYGLCDNYRGAHMDPNNLINLSRNFSGF